MKGHRGVGSVGSPRRGQASGGFASDFRLGPRVSLCSPGRWLSRGKCKPGVSMCTALGLACGRLWGTWRQEGGRLPAEQSPPSSTRGPVESETGVSRLLVPLREPLHPPMGCRPQASSSLSLTDDSSWRKGLRGSGSRLMPGCSEGRVTRGHGLDERKAPLEGTRAAGSAEGPGRACFSGFGVAGSSTLLSPFTTPPLPPDFILTPLVSLSRKGPMPP